MRTKSVLMAIALFCNVALEGRAASYTNKLVCGWNFIANQLDGQSVGGYSGNRLDLLFPGPGDFSYILQWDQAHQAFDIASTYFLGAWDHPSRILEPGEGALFFSSGSYDECAVDFTVSGTERVPSLPVAFVRNSYRALSRQAPGPGTYENITGLSPDPGCKFIRFDRDSQLWRTNTFDGSAWSLGIPAARVGEGVLIYFPPVVQPLVLTNLVFTPANGGSFSLQVIGTTNVLTRVQYSTDISGTNWITATNDAPASGAFTYTTNGTGVSGHRFYRAQYSF